MSPSAATARALGLRAALAAALLACSAAPPKAAGPTPLPDDIPSEATAWISPSGDDAASGAREAPLRTLGAGLARPSVRRLVLLAGRHEGGPIRVDRAIRVEGDPSGGDGAEAILAAPLELAADHAELLRLRLVAGLQILGAQEIALDTLTIEGGAGAPLRLERAAASLREIELVAGADAGLFAEGSTITVEGLRIEGGAAARGLRVLGGRARVRGLEVSGTRIAQAFVAEGGVLELTGGRLSEAQGSALAAVGGGRLVVDGLLTERPRGPALLAARAIATVRGSTLAGGADQTVAVQSATVALDRVRIEASARGTISVTRHSAAGPALVVLQGGRVDHAAVSALLLDQGRVEIDGTRFVGAGRGEEDALVASGPTAELVVRRATIERSGGFGVGLYNGAGGTLSATVTEPGLGGVIVEATAAVRVEDLAVRRCRDGSGVVVFDASEVTLRRVSVTACPEAGVLAGDGAHVELTGGILTDDREYGVAAFGGARVRVSGVRISGSRWATFATCGDGARVTTVGRNDIDGDRVDCP